MGDECENDNTAMVKFMAKFRRLARAGAGVALLHHLNADGSRSRGGTSITSSTDFAMLVNKKIDGDGTLIELREDRFRMCDAWELDIRAHWRTPDHHATVLAQYYDERPTAYRFKAGIAERFAALKAGKKPCPLAQVLHDKAEVPRVPYPEDFYQLEMVRDQLVKDAIREKEAVKKDKKAELSAKDEADTKKVVAAILKTDNSPSTIGNVLTMSRDRVKKLAERDGHVFTKGPKPQWSKV
jgi:hypothetical protein